MCNGMFSLQWCHNGRGNHHCLLNGLFSRSKKTSKPRVTGLCVGNSPETGEFPAQMASNAENVSIWWRHRVHGNGFMSMVTIKQNKAQTVCITLGMYSMHCIGKCYSKNVVSIWTKCTTHQNAFDDFGTFFTFVALNVSILITPSHPFISCNENHFDGSVQDYPTIQCVSNGDTAVWH